MPAAVGDVVTVAPCYVLIVFVGVCVTVTIVPIFYVDPACSFCVTYQFIISSSNDSVIFYMLDIFKLCCLSGVRMGGGGGYWYKVALRNVPLKKLKSFMCYARLGTQLAVMPGAEMFSVDTHSTFISPLPREMHHSSSLVSLLAQSLPLLFCPRFIFTVSILLWG